MQQKKKEKKKTKEGGGIVETSLFNFNMDREEKRLGFLLIEFNCLLQKGFYIYYAQIENK